MYRVCLEKATGKLIEMQSGGNILPPMKDVLDEKGDLTQYGIQRLISYKADNLETLRRNAINAGYKEDELDVKWVSDEEWKNVLEANKPKPTYADLRQAEYPSIGDQLDAIWEGEPHYSEMKAVIMAIKAKYPKPV